MDYARRLIHVPILHSPADMGSMAEGLAAAMIERLGRRHWDEYLALLDDFWQMVRTELERLGLDYMTVDLYQDGLPVCGKELELVQKAAAAGSENHQLLLDLVAKGASLMGTEDPRLLLDEYRDVKTALETDGASKRGDTLAKRDAYIGRRISQSLGAGRTGVLFIGMLHDVEAHLPADIVTTRLVSMAGAHKDKGR
ncbi:MAG: hypothetical protein ABR964_06020 [Tepidisphaeraceae bacterium]